MRIWETICAIATPLQNAPIGIIRISGDKSLWAVKKLIYPDIPQIKPRFLYLRKIYEHPETRKGYIDEVLLAYMKAPNSYTGEDMVEIYAHGNVFILTKIMSLLFKLGIREALPGEFSYRAVINGKMSLEDALRINEIISAKDENILNYVNDFSKPYILPYIERLKSMVMDILSYINASIDFPEDDFLKDSYDELFRMVEEALSYANWLYGKMKLGEKVKEGALVVLVGRPNVGKSTIFNKLVREERVIVSPYPGTTRDYIDVSLTYKGVHIRLCDTAGLHNDASQIEALGIEKAKSLVKSADIVVRVFEYGDSVPSPSSENEIIVVNKVDKGFGKYKKSNGVLYISAKYDIGLEELMEEIVNKAKSFYKGEPVFVAKSYQNTIYAIIRELIRIRRYIKCRIPFDLIDSRMDKLRSLLGFIGGEITNEEMYDRIFSSFCIGK